MLKMKARFNGLRVTQILSTSNARSNKIHIFQTTKYAAIIGQLKHFSITESLLSIN